MYKLEQIEAETEGMRTTALGARVHKLLNAALVGGKSDVLAGGKKGATVNVNDANMFAGKIQELLDNPEKRMTLGKNARQSILKRFTPENEQESHMAVYKNFGLKL